MKSSTQAFDAYEGLLAQYKEELKEIKKMKCVTHKKSTQLTCDYDLNGVYAYITKCCCQEHAKLVAASLYDIIAFDKITLENCEDLPASVIIKRR